MLPGARSGSTIQEKVFDIFRVVANCAKLINHCHVPFKLEEHPRLDNPMEMSFSRPSDGPSKQEF